MDAVEWHKVAERGDLDDGRVRTVVAGDRTLALTRVGDRYGALDNHCPHQGGPLGEGSIEKGLLRCPWHGYDYDPLTGTPPPGFKDAPACFPIEVRDRRDLRRPRSRTAPCAYRLGRHGRDDGGLGYHPRLRHGRALQPRVRRRHAPPRRGRQPHVHRDPPRRRRRVRGLRVRQAHRTTGRVLRDRRTGIDEPAHRALRREGGSRRRCWPSRARCRRRCSAAVRSRTST